MAEAFEAGTEEVSFRLERVRENIRAACLRAGRNPDEVTLVAVSKTKPMAAIRAAYQAGVRHFGENYVQELTGKLRDPALPAGEEPIRWHMIGHLQKNKVKYLAGQVWMIHSVDSVGLAAQIEREAARREWTAEILLEVNTGGEETKFGFAPEETVAAAREIAAFPHLRLRGLMTSAPYTENGETNRPCFRTLRRLAEQLAREGLIAPAGTEKHRRSSPWACPAIMRLPWRRVPPWSGWERTSSGQGTTDRRTEEKDGKTSEKNS